MSLLDRLHELGERLRIFEARPKANAAKLAKIATRTVTLSDLTTEIRQDELRALAELPAELSIAFEKVFEAAGIKSPGHGWTAARLKQLLESDQFKTMDRPSVQRSVLNILADEKVDVEDIVKDVIAHDQALDAFETFTRKKMLDRIAARQKKVAEVETQIASLQEQRERLTHETETDEQHWTAWLERKRAYERDLSRTISYLVDRLVVSIDEQ
ncbi:MAG: hypothetical protein DMG10_19520 [Acidobacteria bacterium]|nr:MAG: hypothetical protein DMG10_19520 [Acidobacteriota bacterium]PYV39476.1 MAG: hypothetical protein DMG09_09095 [Acidobacteriota bacterium]